MMASYLLSRTLVPTMVNYLLRGELDRYVEEETGTATAGDNIFWRFHHAFNRQFHRFRDGYISLLSAALEHRRIVAAWFIGILAICGALIPFIGTDFFPKVDAGQIRVHVRAPAGTPLEETGQYFPRVEEAIRR